jgi:diguanylate cyclase (GGDEF)-like protein
MTALFEPPRSLNETVPWRHLLRLGPANDPFWIRVRAAQLAYLSRHLPLNLAVLLAMSLVVAAAIVPRASAPALLLWLVLQALLPTLWVFRHIRDRRAETRGSATPGAMRRLLAELALGGSAWGLLFADVLPHVPSSQAMLVVAVAMATVGVTAAVTAIFPLGSLALSGPVLLGTSWGLAFSGWPDAAMTGFVIASHVVVIARGNLLTARAFLARLRAKDRLAEQEEVVRLLLNEFEANGSEWLFEFDGGGRLTFASSRFAEALRCPVEAVVGQHWRHFAKGAAATDFIEVARRGLPFRDVILKVDVEGEPRWWSLSGTPKLDRDGRLVGYRGVGSDVTERQLSAERIAELATFDGLTGLVNRRIINQALSDGLRAPAGVALLFVDLDRFKAVNDSLGHGAGDRLLAEVAVRLRDVLAEEAPGEGLAGRLGGDEFAVVLEGADADQATRIGEAIIRRLARPYQLGDKQAQIGASVGLARGPADGATVEALMRAADLALYDVKGKGRGSVRPYDREMHKAAEDRRSLELDLRNALAAGQMRLAFQPVVDTLDERVVGFEALMRWRHPVHGEISPAIFIPIAEESGQIARIGAWALNEACRTAAQWPRTVKLAVNLSPLQFDDPGLVETVRTALARWKLAPARLELELTESLFLDERPQTADMLARLRAMGVGFALDDFGTGYASLGYLQKIAFTRIKIDRSFVRASVAEGGESLAIVQAIVALADRLGMETTAEGTETRAEFEAMRRLGCAQVQGYYFGKPMSAEDAARLIDRAAPRVELSDPDVRPGPGPRSRAANVLWPAAAERTSPPGPRARRAPLRG